MHFARISASSSLSSRAIIERSVNLFHSYRGMQEVDRCAINGQGIENASATAKKLIWQASILLGNKFRTIKGVLRFGMAKCGRKVSTYCRYLLREGDRRIAHHFDCCAAAITTKKEREGDCMGPIRKKILGPH